MQTLLTQDVSYFYKQSQILWEAACSLKTADDVWQMSGGREPGDGVGREATHRGPAADQEEVEGGERRQARAAFLQVRVETNAFEVNICVRSTLALTRAGVAV